MVTVIWQPGATRKQHGSQYRCDGEKFVEIDGSFELEVERTGWGDVSLILRRHDVRINLDPNDLARHPLRVGLSMKATIDVADR